MNLENDNNPIVQHTAKYENNFSLFHACTHSNISWDELDAPTLLHNFTN